MSTFPEFGAALKRLLHKTTAKECLSAARKLRERKEELTRDVLEKFDVNNEYEAMLNFSPILMTVIHAASSNNKLKDIKVQLILK